MQLLIFLWHKSKKSEESAHAMNTRLQYKTKYCKFYLAKHQTSNSCTTSTSRSPPRLRRLPRRFTGRTGSRCPKKPRPKSSVTPSKGSATCPSAWPRPTCRSHPTRRRRGRPRGSKYPSGTSGRLWGQGSSTPWLEPWAPCLDCPPDPASMTSIWIWKMSRSWDFSDQICISFQISQSADLNFNLCAIIFL